MLPTCYIDTRYQAIILNIVTQLTRTIRCHIDTQWVRVLHNTLTLLLPLTHPMDILLIQIIPDKRPPFRF